MIWYLLVSAILLYCFEIIGRYLLYKLNIDGFKCCFGIGIILFLSYSYITTSLITFLNGPFFLVSIIYALFFIILIALVIKDNKKISFRLNLLNVILLVMFEAIMIYFAYNTSLGDLNGFDSTHYLNLVTANIKSNTMNIAYFNNAIKPTTIGVAYSFQSFYYIASFFSYIFAYVINFVHKTYYQTVYIWIFQIIFNAFFFSLIVNSINLMKMKNKNIFTIIFLVFFVLVYGRLYYYNVFGFYGNTYRIITVGYSSLIIYLLTKHQNSNNMLRLFACSLLASSAVSSTGVFIDIFIMFGAYFILCDKYKDLLKYYAFVLLFILPNLLLTSIQINIIVSVLMTLLLSLILYIFSDYINKFLSNKKVLISLLIFSFIFMFVSSLLVTHNIFDFSSFFSNHSETADMNINYFNLKSSFYLIYLKVFILFLLISSLLSIKKEPFVRFICILLICIFNPFCSAFIYKILSVYFRAFDIIVNPFTIILYIDYLLLFFKENIIFKSILLIVLIFISIQNDFTKPLYYHESFKPGYSSKGIDIKNYNGEFKMPQDEIDAIDAIYNDVLYRNIDEAYIVSPCLLTQSFIPNGKYLFIRNEYEVCPYTYNNEKQLYAIFYPERYLGDLLIGIEPDYNNMRQYIKNACIDYLVVDKTKEYFDKDNNVYSLLYYKVLDNFYPMFENESYLVICCIEQ